jgi:ABC-2 type transport system permease protein
MSIMLFTFVLFYLVNLNESLNPLKYLTPFKYFDAAVLMKDGLDPVFVTLSLVIVVLGIAGTYYFYSRRDLSV